MFKFLGVLLLHRGWPLDYTSWEDDMHDGFWKWLKEERAMGLSRYPWEPPCKWELEHRMVKGRCVKCQPSSVTSDDNA